MNARNFFMTDSGLSRVRDSSYENRLGLAGYGVSSSMDATPSPSSRLAGWTRVAASLVVAATTLLAACGSLPVNVGKTDSSALAPDPESPLVKIVRTST